MGFTPLSLSTRNVTIKGKAKTTNKYLETKPSFKEELNLLLRSGKQKNSLHLRDPRNQFSMLNWFFFSIRINSRNVSLCVENLKTRKTVSFETISSIQQRFRDLSTQRIPIVLKKSFYSCKVLLGVKKLSFLLHGHNSYNVFS